MRLDRYLYFIRLVKSRSSAQSVIENGVVRLNGRRVEKSAANVAVGNIIALSLHDQVRVLRVVRIPSRRGPAAEASACYDEVGN